MKKKWLNSLYSYGITDTDILNTTQQLAKKFGKEPSENDVIWSLFNQSITKTGVLQNLKMIYYDMALFLNEEGRNFFHILQQSRKMELMYYKKMGIKRVQIRTASNSCDYCKQLTDSIFTIDDAFTNMPIPCSECTYVLKKGKSGFCRCCYVAYVE